MISNQTKIPPIQELFNVNKLPLKIYFDFSPRPIKISEAAKLLLYELKDDISMFHTFQLCRHHA